MINYNALLDDSICSKVWLEPIKSTTQSTGVEKLGLEMEFHAFDANTLAPLGTEQSTITPQILLSELATLSKNFSLSKDPDTDEIIGVNLPNGGNFSLEPGGQIEYASIPSATLSELVTDIHSGLELLERAAQKKVLFLSHGTNPIATPSHPLVVPKKRYQFMTRYFQSAPTHIRGIDMMRYSATVQPNLDIFGNLEWYTGVRLILNLVPITSALFANSKYFQGRKSKFYSERQNIWENMDPTRSGIPPNLLSSPDCLHTECAYAKWAKKAYVLFIDYLSLNEQPAYGELTFEQWLHDGYKNTHPTVADWETHLSTLFPHLRLRQFLEIRNIDAQPFEYSFVPIAFFSAILKNKKTQQKTEDLLLKYHVNTTEAVDAEQNFKEIFNPLLDLSAEILNTYKDDMGVASLQSYKNFLTFREQYWDAPNALEFVKLNSTCFPAEEFSKYLQI